MMNYNTHANGATFLLLLIDSTNPPSWTSRAVAPNESCPAFGVTWSPVHSRLFSACLSWRLSVIFCACTFASRSSLSPSPTILLSSSQSLTSSLMSHTHPTSTSSNFQLILDNALKAYKKRTKKDLLKHPLADRLQACNSPSSILTVLQEQVQELNQSQRSNQKWLDPTVNVLLAFSETLGEGAGSVFSPAKAIFVGFAVLLSVCSLLDTFVRSIAIQTILRQLRPFARTKTLFLRCSSASKLFSNVWTYTLK